MCIRDSSLGAGAREGVREYYGETLQSSDDLKTSACCNNVAPHPAVIAALQDVPDIYRGVYQRRLRRRPAPAARPPRELPGPLPELPGLPVRTAEQDRAIGLLPARPKAKAAPAAKAAAKAAAAPPAASAPPPAASGGVAAVAAGAPAAAAEAPAATAAPEAVGSAAGPGDEDMASDAEGAGGADDGEAPQRHRARRA